MTLQQKASEILSALKKQNVTLQSRVALRAKYGVSAFESESTMFKRIAMVEARKVLS